MKTGFTAFAVSFISVFGLVSCTAGSESGPGPSSDSPPTRTSPPAAQAPAVNPAQDNWKISRPVLQTVRLGKSVTVDWLNASVDPVDVDSIVVFQEPEENSPKGVSIQFKAICKNTDTAQELSSEVTVRGTWSTPLTSILPQEIFVQGVNPSLQFNCHIDVTAMNSNKSTFHFIVPGIRLAHLETLEKVKLTLVNAAQATIAEVLDNPQAAVEAQSGPSLRLNSELSVRLPRKADLFCTGFHNHRSVGTDEALDATANNLINGQILPTPTDPYDPRASFLRQSCRFVLRSFNNESGITTTLMTRLFQLNFMTGSGSAVTDLGSFGQDIWGQIHLSEKPFYIVQVYNPSIAPTAYRFSGLTGQTLFIQPISVNGMSRAIHLGQTFSMPTTYAVVGASRQWNVGSQLAFEIPPHGRVTIALTVAGDWRCHRDDGSISVPGAGGIVGYAYRFSQPMPLEQYLQWNPSNIQFVDQFVPLAVTQVPLGFDGPVLNGWVPSPDWQRAWPGNPARPAITEGPVPQDAITCQSGPMHIYGL